MAEYSWPSRSDATIIGKSPRRLDGMVKSTGAAKYSYDVNLDKQLYAVGLGCPSAHCKIKSIDTSGAEETPGVVHVHVFDHAKPDEEGELPEVQWQGELLVAVAAETEAAAREGVSKIKLDLEELDVFTDVEDLEAAEAAGRARRAGERAVFEQEPGDDDNEDEFEEKELARLFKESKHIVEGYYGIDSITHCCLEPHGSTVEYKDGKLTAHLSTQNVSGTDDQFAADLEITADDVSVHCDYIGGGFGSKFAADYWGLAAARISRATGRPVKFMLDRDQELKNAGNRPSGYLRAKFGADAEGVVKVWESHHWGTAGYRGGGVSVSQVPYVIVPKNYRSVQTQVNCNTAQSRAWRAPNHPQACAMTQTALDDLAAKMGVSSLDVFRANIRAGNVNSQHPNAADTYLNEIDIAAKAIDWDDNWHAHGKGRANGSIVDGLGMALHTWGGGANNSTCRLRVSADGSVESFCGTQDLGTGTRTVINQVLAETLGLRLRDVKHNIGSSKYPASGASGGSTTVGAVCESHRRAAQDAFAKICDLVAAEIGAEADQLVAKDSRIFVKGSPDKGISWKKACSLIGVMPLEVTASHTRGNPSSLSSSGVCGVQMAHVTVDKEIGVVKVRKFVAVQDQGLVINRRTCKSQIYGAVIMGIAASIYERRITDPSTGAFVNAEMGDYKLARLGDIGEIDIRLYEPDSERARGVIGNGEPPAVSPMAAIANATANALGVRVSVVPLTPKRVLEALAKA
jgi:xanthine dehydrogenase YagR molybdenum-binding subunit